MKLLKNILWFLWDTLFILLIFTPLSLLHLGMYISYLENIWEIKMIILGIILLVTDIAIIHITYLNIHYYIKRNKK